MCGSKNVYILYSLPSPAHCLWSTRLKPAPCIRQASMSTATSARLGVVFAVATATTLMCPCRLAWAAAPPTLHAGELVVTLDKLLPRPASVVYRGVNLTAATRSMPQPSPAPPSPAPSPATGNWWTLLDGFALITTSGGDSCASPHCSSYTLPAGTSNPAGALACNASCTADPTCAGWSMILVTPTSGQRGKSPLCQQYATAGLATSAPFYLQDDNFACGSKRQLQRYPPVTPAPTPAPPKVWPLPVSRGCIVVLATNGSNATFCAASGEAVTR